MSTGQQNRLVSANISKNKERSRIQPPKKRDDFYKQLSFKMFLQKITISFEELGEIRDYFFPRKKVITPLQSDENHSLDNHGSFWRSLLSLLIISQITFWLRSRQKFLFLICIPLLQDLQMKKKTIIRCWKANMTKEIFSAKILINWYF